MENNSAKRSNDIKSDGLKVLDINTARTNTSSRYNKAIQTTKLVHESDTRNKNTRKKTTNKMAQSKSFNKDMLGKLNSKRHNVRHFNKSRKKRFNFRKFLAIYASVLALIGVVLLIMLYVFLKDYEESIPSNEMDNIISQMETDKLNDLINQSDIEFNEFEDASYMVSSIHSLLNENELSYSKKLGEYTSSNPVYIVSIGDSELCKVTLKTEDNKKGFFNQWELGSIEFGEFSESTAITLTVPSGSNIYLNDTKVSSNYLTQTGVNFSPCLNVSSYVTAPTNDVYTIDGFNLEPQIKVVYEGDELEFTSDSGNITAYYPSDDSLYEMASNLGIEVLECYGKYIINRGDLNTLQSYMVGKANSYVANIPAVWAFLVGKKFTYEFQNESTSNLRVYSDDCFSIDVSCVLYVDWTDGNKSYDTAYTYTFVKINGNWKVADLEVL